MTTKRHSNRATLDIGSRFGLLVVAGMPRVNEKIRREIPCVCDCGNYKYVDLSSLRCGKIISCGCMRSKRASERASDRNKTHGAVGTPEYSTWAGIKARCLNTNHHGYKNYGGRGIAICERWMDFANFLADMGPRQNGTSIDRINPNGGYSPENCRWASSFVQTRNRRNSVLISHRGFTLNACDWEAITGLPILRRVKSGKTGDALFAPLGRTSKYCEERRGMYEAACAELQRHYNRLAAQRQEAAA